MVKENKINTKKVLTKTYKGIIINTESEVDNNEEKQKGI